MVSIASCDLNTLPFVFDLVNKLYQELEIDLLFSKEIESYLKEATEKTEDSFWFFVALDENQKAIGALTLSESFAFFANGRYGIINELYVLLEYRSKKIGAQLIEQAKQIAKKRGWQRIDVTAPPGPEGKRSIHFYQQEGFKEAGPKLKYLLS